RERDAAVAAFETAEAAVAAAEAALRSAELDLSYTQVRAPISGLIGREVRSEGSLVTAGSEPRLLTHIDQADRVYVVLSVPAAEGESLRAALQESRKGGKEDAVSVRVVDARGAALADQASIEFMAPSVGEETGTVEVRAILDNTSRALLPGQVVRARIEGVNLPNTVAIPKRAVMHGIQGSFVWVIGEDDKVAPRPVELGISSGNNVVVTRGLETGERVVVEGILKVQPGALVRANMIGPEGDPESATTEQKAAS